MYFGKWACTLESGHVLWKVGMYFVKWKTLSLPGTLESDPGTHETANKDSPTTNDQRPTIIVYRLFAFVYLTMVRKMSFKPRNLLFIYSGAQLEI